MLARKLKVSFTRIMRWGLATESSLPCEASFSSISTAHIYSPEHHIKHVCKRGVFLNIFLSALRLFPDKVIICFLKKFPSDTTSLHIVFLSNPFSPYPNPMLLPLIILFNLQSVLCISQVDISRSCLSWVVLASLLFLKNSAFKHSLWNTQGKKQQQSENE